MLTLINKELFSFADKKRDEDYQIDIFSTPQATKYSVKDNKALPNKRQILRILSQAENYKDYKSNISVRDIGNNKKSVLIKANDQVNRDANVFVVAFPFNGLIKPIPYSKEYRIYKGIIASSDSFNIVFNNKKYKNVLYLVIEPNMNLFNEDHKYHTDAIKIEIESVVLDKGGEKIQSVRDVLSLSITKDGHGCEMERFELGEVIDISHFAKDKIYHQFQIAPQNDRRRDNQQDYQNNNHRKPNQKPATWENKKPQTKKSDNLDSMIMDAGLYDETEYNNRDRNNRRKNRR